MSLTRSVVRVIATTLLVVGCQSTAQQHATAADTSFAATQARRQMVMGVDQYTSAHVFEDLPDGGRIGGHEQMD